MRLVSLVRASCSRARVLRRATLIVVAIAAASAPLAAQSGSVHPIPSPHVLGVARQGSVTIDGVLDEAAWSAATPATNFTQQDPHEGQSATQRTEVRFLYDDEAVYVGARMWDSLGAAGVRTRLVRRDQDADGDWFHVIFDTYHDHLGRALFQINPSGVKNDELSVAGSGFDASWDPVWQAATSIDSLGWTAEMRIPLSQLRYARDSSQLWGLQVRRFVSRLNEAQQWAFWRRNETGGPARFGHLFGLRTHAGARHLELLPYAVTRSAFVRPQPGDPFNDGSRSSYRVGGDLKYLLTSNLTLDATINPDFGQVEVDPAVVNLSQFETFFPERRPFFIEGAGIFDFAPFNCMFCSNVSSLETFYSRRIGRAPQLNGLVAGNAEYADVPDNSTILGAAKVTGRTRRGFSLGILDAVTRRETARAFADGLTERRVVEPLTNYFVGRVKRDYRGGNLTVGAIGTSVTRSVADSLLASRLSRGASLGGLDLSATWDRQRYSFLASAAASEVHGDTAALRRVQVAPQHYFQRPDRTGSGAYLTDRYDPAATSMRGVGGYARLAKDGGDFRWEAAVNTRTPGYEVNDISYLQRADYLWHNGNVAYQWSTPTRWFRRLIVIGGGQEQFNYDGDLTDHQLQTYAGGQLPNLWNVSTFHIHRGNAYDDRLTRGGPVGVRAGFDGQFLNVSTDSRKWIVGSTSAQELRSNDGRLNYGVNVGVTVKPRSNVSLALEPGYDRSRTSSQYVTAFADRAARAGFAGRRYVFSDLDQRTLSMDTRLNVTFTPNLSLELFAQPFLSSIDFSRFKEFAAPRQITKLVYGEDAGSTVAVQRNVAGRETRYTIDPDGPGPAAAFAIDNPDFKVRSLRGNAVLRWEYLPGSTVFFVWTQSRDGQGNTGDFRFNADRAALFREHPDNIFLVKVNYWLGR